MMRKTTNPYKEERIREGLIPAESAKDDPKKVVSISPYEDFGQSSDHIVNLSGVRYKSEIESQKLSDKETLFKLEKYKDEKLLFQELDLLMFTDSTGRKQEAMPFLFRFFERIMTKDILDEDPDVIKDNQKLVKIRAIKQCESEYRHILNLTPPEKKTS